MGKTACLLWLVVFKSYLEQNGQSRPSKNIQKHLIISEKLQDLPQRVFSIVRMVGEGWQVHRDETFITRASRENSLQANLNCLVHQACLVSAPNEKKEA